MKTRRVTIELDEHTVRRLGVLGEPAQMVAQLATSAVDAVFPSGDTRRRQTNESLRLERDEADMGSEQKETARDNTDEKLGGERIGNDSTLLDMREANTRMVGATIRAQELAEEAGAALKRAEQKARELAETAEFREMFMGILGHDLRTPLAAIMLATGLMRRQQLDPVTEKQVARILRSGGRMNRMIGQLLDLTRARLGGGLPLDEKPTDLREVCQRAVEEFEAPIHLELEGDLTGIWDPDRLAEVLSNLTANAIAYAAPGTPVTLKASAEPSEVVVEIANRGEPIPPEVLPFIFDPFRRAKQREKSPAGNLGLGLYIAKQIVLSHGGTLEGHSSGGKTTFVVHLPRQSDRQPQASSP